MNLLTQTTETVRAAFGPEAGSITVTRVTLGGIVVTDPDAALDIISEAGSGYHLFGESAERIVVVPSE